MKPRTNTILPLAVIAGIALSASAGAATIVTNFVATASLSTSGDLTSGHYTGGLNSTIAFNPTTPTFTFRYDITGLGLGAADHLLITATSAGGNLTNTTHGISVASGGADNSNWWTNSDGPLSFVVAIRNASNVDITSSHTVDLTGASLRWGNGTPASTFSIAGSGPFSFADVSLQKFTLPTGQTNETAFSATRNNDAITQFAQLRFDIAAIPEPTSAMLGGLGMLALVLRRRRA